MKKLLLVFLSSLALLLIFSPPVYAAELCVDPVAGGGTSSNFITNGTGLVPCGQTAITYNANGTIATGCPCQLGHLIIMAFRIYRFAVYMIALPVAGILMVLGGILILLSGINAKWFETGKTILWNTGIALVLIFGSYLIIDAVLHALGYLIVWNVF